MIKNLLFILLLLVGCAVIEEPTYENAKNYAEKSLFFENEDPEKFNNLDNLDVDKCIKIAIDKNLDYKIILERIEKSKASLIEARASFFPVLNTSLRYMHADSAGNYFYNKLEQRKFLLQGDLNYPDDLASSNLSFNINYGINLGGMQFFQNKIAKLKLDSAKLEKEKFINILVDSIIIAYYNILASENYFEISGKSVETISSQVKETKIKYEGGAALKSDLLALEVRLAEAKENVIRAKNGVKLAKNSLAYLMGMKPNIDFEIIKQDWEPRSLPKNYEEAIKIAFSNRAELKQARQNLIIAKYGLEVAKSEFAPNLEAFGSYYFEDRGFKYSSNRDNWKVGVALSFDIFNGFSRYSRNLKAKALIKEMAIIDKKTVLEIEHEVDRAYRNWDEAKERLKVLEITIKQAEENFNLVKTQFEGGTATITKYLNSELALQNARFQLTNASYDLKKAKAIVGKALGMCGLCVK